MGKNVFYLCVLFCLGFFLGIFWWESGLGTGNPVVLRSLRGESLKTALRTMVMRQSLDRVFVNIKKAFPAEYPWMHEQIGHIVGNYMYTRYGIRAFALCDSFLNMGCYHGVIEGAARVHGYSPTLYEDVERVCEETLESYKDCTHPMGHAATILAHNNILIALGTCDGAYSEQNDLFECWDGAIMEYQTALKSSSLSATPVEDPAEILHPHFPCNTYPARYESACVRHRLVFLASEWSYDFPRLVTYCNSYTNEFTMTRCLDTMGEEAAKKHFYYPKLALDACAYAGRGSDHCVMGVFKTYKAYKDEARVSEICPAFVDSTLRDYCMSSE